MKKINEILTHIQNTPSFDKINTFLEIKRFVNILPLKLKSGIKFAYLKNDTLVFVLIHQIYKVEFEYAKNDILALIKSSNFKNITKLSFFVSNSVERVKKGTEESVEKYDERAYGIFENRVKDEKLFKKFEDIRAIIKGS
ncbi:DUF721 domain-containing protein [Aliarcobacter vitoriensis]|uniref:DUF721 domain-containing protein n=1 Tax=Aliarcobacter vitoriensis TaxID=2011099 RepID=A0A366MSF3_9BACT|nr:DUF721 domain-containing protein [Aliarcobacter vitoriensis]RBQ29218.1 hypothetical protein CRU91_05145 [Aliarcobacter vitoriensis]